MKTEITRDRIFNIIVQNTCVVIPELEGHSFVETDRLADLGANSMDRAEIVMMTLESLSLKIPLIELVSAKNIGKLADLLHEKHQST
ncbi:MAG: acyl carrier protein [Cuspidothrix sp.]|jgi:polyketide biosynthesis acyl carrier protein|uniref:CusG n=1 Tax=Cuspidothrix issatschenkoi CHARLIE-1 TaxID=2052836 RepID=A0A2R3ZDP2_9CYAN|nr:acyl carrier protein [Cuspidothrix issatschenkoi]AVR48538.1 CusG [Cuspidothrix issatschenkoi CHARLIE-1]